MGVLRTQLIDAAQRPARMLLMGSAMIIASFVAFGTVLASQITERTVLDNLSGTPAAVDFVIGGEGQGVNAQTLTAVRAIPGVAEAGARTEVAYAVVSQDYVTVTVHSDPGSGPLTRVDVTQGRYPSAADEIAVTRRTVDRLGVVPGGTLRITPMTYDETSKPAQPVTLTVVGVVDAPEDFGEDVYTTDDVALRLAESDWVSRIEVRLAPDADADTVLAAMNEAVARTAPEEERPTISTGEQVRYDEALDVSDRVNGLFALIGMFVAIAVVAAALVATSTFRIVFAQRMRQLALLRAIGADRAGLFRALVAEGGLTGLLAGVAGVLAVTGLGFLLPPLLRVVGIDIATPGFPIGWAVAVVLGTALITMVAVLAPAVTAARVAPLEALRTASTTAGARGINLPRVAVGLLMSAAAVLVAFLVASQLPDRDTQAYDPSGTLLQIVLSGLFAYVALVALGPLLVRPVLAAVGWPLRRFGPIGRLAVGGVGGQPRRAAAVSVVVALGVTLIGGALVGTASLRTLIKWELAGMAPSDLAVTVAEEQNTLPEGFVDRVRAMSELERVVPFRNDPTVRLAGVDIDGLAASDLALHQLSTWEDFGTSSGTLDIGPGRVVLLSYLAEAANVQPGDPVTLTRGGRSIELRLVGIMDNTPVSAGMLLDPTDLDRLGTPPNPTGLLADVAGDGEEARTAAVKALRAVTGSTLLVEVSADMRDDMMGELNMIIGVLLALLGLTVIVAVVGVGATTALSVVERTRELGLLRAIGMARAGLRSMLTAEAGLYGLVGATLGLLLALPYSWLAVEALGADAPVEFPAGQLALVVLVLAAATALAGLPPARRAARVSPVAALGVDG